MKKILAATLVGLGMVLSSCSGGAHKDAGSLLGAPDDAGSWARPGRDMGDSYFSPLEGIDSGNAGKLGLAWEFDDFLARGRSHYAMQSTPVLVDGTLYFSGPWGEAYAVDARTGKLRWLYDTAADGEYARNGCCGISNRGVAVADGKLFVGALDGNLFALDLKTGKPVWKVDTFVDRHWNYAQNGAPQIAGNVVIIGNAGAEMGSRGYVSAYDVKTGKLAWRFWAVPGDPAKGPDESPEVTLARKTWPADSRWDLGLGGNAWNGLAYDPETDTAFIGFGNGGPHPAWLRSKSGKIMDNLFLSSIVAVNAKTGRMKWYYQETPGDSWDYTATAPMVLAQIRIDGKLRKVLMQAPKNGMFYVLDRDTGKLLRANPYTRVNWNTGVDMTTGRPKINPDVIYKDGPKLIWPSAAGGHGWTPMAFSPRTGLVYVPTYDAGMSLEAVPHQLRFLPGTNDQAAEGHFPPFTKEQLAGRPQSKFEGRLTAWDPVAGKARWTAPSPTFLNGGTMVAGDLVFQGNAAGYLNAFDAANGKQVAHIFVGTAINAAPMTYKLDGVQYIAVLAGAGGPQGVFFSPGVVAGERENYQRLIVLKVDGGKIPLPDKRVQQLSPLPKPIPASATVLAKGQALFMEHCSRCHAAGGAVAVYPNLWTMPQSTIDSFEQIVGKGALVYGGMGNFSNVLSPSDIAAVKAFIVDDTISRRTGKGTTVKERTLQTH